MKYREMTWGRMEAVVNKLGGMEGVERLLRGEVDIVDVDLIIDCDADPQVPVGLDGWQFHRRHGKLQWGPDKLGFYMCDWQHDGAVQGKVLYAELKEQPVLNAVVLEHLLARPYLIPEKWKGKMILFWGTIYTGVRGSYVRYLHWENDDTEWYEGTLNLEQHVLSESPAAVLVE